MLGLRSFYVFSAPRPTLRSYLYLVFEEPRYRTRVLQKKIIDSGNSGKYEALGSILGLRNHTGKGISGERKRGLCDVRIDRANMLWSESGKTSSECNAPEISLTQFLSNLG